MRDILSNKEKLNPYNKYKRPDFDNETKEMTVST